MSILAFPQSKLEPARAPWAPQVTVAAVIERDGQVLLVDEQRKDGRTQLNQPAGHLECGESLVQAMVRETLEETGWDVEATGFIGAYQWQMADGSPFLRFAFTARLLQHHPQRALDHGIIRALWMSPDALLAQYQAQPTRLRSRLVWDTVADWLGGQRYPLDILKYYS